MVTPVVPCQQVQAAACCWPVVYACAQNIPLCPGTKANAAHNYTPTATDALESGGTMVVEWCRESCLGHHQAVGESSSVIPQSGVFTPVYCSWLFSRIGREARSHHQASPAHRRQASTLNRARWPVLHFCGRTYRAAPSCQSSQSGRFRRAAPGCRPLQVSTFCPR